MDLKSFDLDRLSRKVVNLGTPNPPNLLRRIACWIRLLHKPFRGQWNLWSLINLEEGTIKI